MINLRRQFRRLFRFRASNSSVSIGTVQSRPAIWSLFNLQQFIQPQVDLALLAAIRQGIPIVNAAITKLVNFAGCPEIVPLEGASDRFAADANAFLSRINVNGHQVGLDSFVGAYLNDILEYGSGAAEIVDSQGGKDVYGVVMIPRQTVFVRYRENNPLLMDVVQRVGGADIVMDERHLLYGLLEMRDGNPTGCSLLATLPTVAEAMLTIRHAIKQTWERCGDPVYHVNYIPPDSFTDDPEMTKASAVNATLAANWKKVMQSKHDATRREDFTSVGNVVISAIGGKEQVLEVEAPHRAIMEEIVAQTGLPPFLLGLHWSTTERMSVQQIQVLLAQVEDLRRAVEPGIEYLIEYWGRLRGHAERDWRIEWPDVILVDRTETAQAELVEAQAEAKRQEILLSDWRNGVIDQAGYADLRGYPDKPVRPMEEPQMGNLPFSLTMAQKDLWSGRGQTWRNPALGEVYRSFMADSMDALDQMQAGIWMVLGIPDEKTAKAPIEIDRQQEIAVADLVDEFLAMLFGPELDKAGFVSPDVQDGIVQEHDVFAFRLGVGRAAALLGVDQAQIVPARADPAVLRYLQIAFDKLSEQGEIRLAGIKPEIHQILGDAVAARENPLDTGKRLSERFDHYRRYEFDRLARTEIGNAEVQGMARELQAQGEEEVQIDVAATACDACQAFAGAIVAVDDYDRQPLYHPNCVCSIVPLAPGKTFRHGGNHELHPQMPKVRLAVPGRHATGSMRKVR
jgi:hypothetical protein